jgi:hypothetical protein
LTGGLFGVGGGVIIVPILTGPFKLSQHQAHGTSLATIGATALVSVVVYGMHGNVAWTTAIIVALSSILAARHGARLAARTPSRQLTRAFALFLIVVAIRMLWKAPVPAETPLHTGLVGLGLTLVVGVLAGLLSGFMGVGGGVFAVPAFTLLFGMPQQLAQGTSLAMILGAAPAGAIEHARHGNMVGRLVPWLALGAVVGGPVASLWVQNLPQALVARAFAVFLMLNALRALLRQRRD